MDYEYYSKPNCYTFHELFCEQYYDVDPEFMQTFENIRKTAAEIHANVNQYYDGTHPYVFHLDMVADQFLYLYAKATENWNHELHLDILLMLIFAAYFHDTIEDCRLHYTDVLNYAKSLIGQHNAEHAADIVFALTEEKGKTSAARHCNKYFEGIASIRYASIIKTADICANAIYSWYKSEKQYNKYLKEWNECSFKMMDDTGAELSHRVYCVAIEHMKNIPLIYPTSNYCFCGKHGPKTEKTNIKGITINNIELRVYPENEDHSYAAEIICWYPNVYYNRKNEFIQDQLNPEYYIGPNGCAGRVHEGCFLHPKSCYVVAFVTKGNKPRIVPVCDRPKELNEQNKADFEKIIKHIFEYALTMTNINC